MSNCGFKVTCSSSGQRGPPGPPGPATPPHNLLDANQNQDTVAAGANRGALITGNIEFKWERLDLGAVGQVLGSNGGEALWIGGIQLLNSSAGGATVDFTLPTGFFAYKLILAHVSSSAASSLLLRTSADGGSNFDSGGGDYAWVWTYNTDGSLPGGLSSSILGPTTGIVVFVQNSTNAGDYVSCEINLYNPAVAKIGSISFNGMYLANGSGPLTTFNGSGARLTEADFDAIRLVATSGTLSGAIRLYGMGTI